jgi:hypothetical protein
MLGKVLLTLVSKRREKWCDRKLPNIRVPPQSINKTGAIETHTLPVRLPSKSTKLALEKTRLQNFSCLDMKQKPTTINRKQ